MAVNTSESFLIIGLGNPGEKYKNTRHNIGFRVLDSFLEKMKNQPASVSTLHDFASNEKFKSHLAQINLEGQKIFLAKPDTFMNLSGEAVSAIESYYKIALDKILVVHDDIDFPLGTLRFSKNASSAGHNGVKSIIEKLGTQNFVRLRIGVFSDEKKQIPTEEFVLKNFTEKEEDVEKIISKATEAIEYFIQNGFENSASRYN